MTGAPETLRVTKIDDFLAECVQGSAIASYAAALVVDGQVALAAGGELRAGMGERVVTTTPFHICSCSKAFTALLFAKLVARRLTSWDAAVADIVPAFELPDAWVSRHATFRDLAGMRVGLQRNGIAEWGFRPEARVEERLGRVRFMSFDAPFRDRFSYSNLCYIALAKAAAQICGLSVEACIREIILQPLQLSNAGLHATAWTALPHMPIDGRMTPVPELTGDSSQGSARVHLSAEDAARWLQAMLEVCLEAVDGRGGEAAEMFACQSLVRPRVRAGQSPSAWGYGFGWTLAEYRGRQIFSHGGGGRGWRASMLLDPATRAGVMVMLSHEGDEAQALALDILELAGGRVPQRQESSGPAVPAETALRPGDGNLRARDVLGVYQGAVTGRVRISQACDERLHFALDDAPAMNGSLDPLGDDIFELCFDSIAMTRMPHDPIFKIRFDRSKSGAISCASDYFGQLRRID